MNDNEIKDLKRQYKTIDNQIQVEVKNLIKLLQTVPPEYISISDIGNGIEILIIQRNSIKSELIANRAF